jgi:DNA polymerase-3 subunit epsilon
VPFLEFEFKRAGLIFSEGVRKIVDVKSIYHKLEPRDLNSAHIKYCGKPLENVHRANRDARATIEILKSQLNQHINLPKDILGLERFSNPRDLNWIDDQGKLAWHNEKTIITFGKNKGKTLEELYKNDPSYFQWILNADFSPQVKEIIKEAAEGRFPKQKEIADE